MAGKIKADLYHDQQYLMTRHNNIQRDKMIRTGIIGFGLSGRVFHAPFISCLEGLELTAIASSRQSEIQTLYPDAFIGTAQDIIDSDRIDLVVITTPNNTHYTLAKQALLNNKHVVLEKPMVMNVEEGEELITLAKERNRLLSVYHNCRWNADFLTIQDVLRQNKIGQLHTWRSSFHRYKKSVRALWKAETDNGGILYDLGSHLVDQVLTLFGWPEKVWADIQTRYPENSACDYFNIRLYYPSLIVELNSDTRVTQSGPRYELHGHNGSYLKYGLDSQEQQLSSGMKPDHPDFGKDPVHGELFYSETEKTDIVPNHKGHQISFYQQLIASIHHGAPLPVTAEQGLDVIRLLKKLEQSSQKMATLSLMI